MDASVILFLTAQPPVIHKPYQKFPSAEGDTEKLIYEEKTWQESKNKASVSIPLQYN